ncbi:MAG: cytochrome d ubiquinol oxidase subunit II [Planctomycetota bacterium]
MTETQLLAGIMLVSLMIYVTTGGADFGGGVWDLLASGPRRRRQRAAIEQAIAPIWEASHVWLILVIVLMFAAFPLAFALIMTALHIPLTLALGGIVLRGSSFVFRKYDRDEDRVHRRWSAVFGAASCFTPLMQGIVIGALGSGAIRIEDRQVVSDLLTGWTGLFPIACGVFALALFAAVAAAYLSADTADDPELREDFRRRALIALALLLPIGAGVHLAALAEDVYLVQRLQAWWAPALVAVTVLVWCTALWALWRRRLSLARFCAPTVAACVVLGWGLAQYPYVLARELTFHMAATEALVQRFLLIALALGAVILFPSMIYLLRLFKAGQADEEDDSVRQSSP